MRARRRRRVLLLGAIASFAVGCSLVRSFDGFDEGHGDASMDAASDSVLAEDTHLGNDGAAGDGAATGDAPTTYRELVMQDHPVGYFPLDEAAGTSLLVDVTGGAPATALNKVKLGEPGIHGTSAYFPGTIDDYVNVGDRFDFAQRDFSFELWVKPTIYDQPYYNPLTKRAFPNGYSVYFTHSGDGLHASFTWDMGGGDAAGTPLYVDFPKVTRVPMPDGASTQYFDSGFVGDWVHVACTFVASSSTMTIYFDGAPAKVGTGVAPTDVAEALRIGFVYIGNLDEIAFYDYALGADRIAAHAGFK